MWASQQHERVGDAFAQDVRTWKVLWEGTAEVPAMGCCYLPGARHCLAAACRDSRVALFEGGEPSIAEQGPCSSARWRPSAALWCSGLPQLLCVAAAGDGTTIAASGLCDSDPSRHLDMLVPYPGLTCSSQG